jgi:hypothetical protein
MGDRFFDSPDWRFIITTQEMETLTLLDRIASNRTVTVTLNAPRIHEGRVPSDNPKVNIPWTDGYAYLSEGDRFIFGMRRDGSGSMDVWSCRFAGIPMLVGTAAEQDNAFTRYVAYDPRQMMFKRPVRDGAGTLPGSAGLTFTGATGRDILVALLTASELVDGPTWIDYTSSPELNDTDPIAEITFQQGCTVGEAWAELEATGTIDTVLTPVFDVAASPVNIVWLETYSQAGIVRNNTIMAWDKPGRNVVAIDNQRDGSGRENSIRYHYGQGGAAAVTKDDAASQTRFGTYFAEKFFPGQTAQAAVELMAEKALLATANGKRTVVVSPSPQRAKQPLIDYLPGDRISVNASRNLLEQVDTQQRVLAIPIQIDDNGTEAVSGLLFTDEGWVGS